MSSSESKDDRADEVEAAESAPSLDPRHCKELVGKYVAAARAAARARRVRSARRARHSNAIETLSGEQVLAMMRAAAPDQKLKYPLHVALSHARFALRDVAALAGARPPRVLSLAFARAAAFLHRVPHPPPAADPRQPCRTSSNRSRSRTTGSRRSRRRPTRGNWPSAARYAKTAFCVL